MAETVMDSLKGIQSVFRPTIYQFRDTKDDELNDIAQQGKLMLMTVYHASEELKTIVEETLAPFTKQLREKQEALIK